MGERVLDRWLPLLCGLGFGVIAVVVNVVSGDYLMAAVVGIVLAALTWWIWPGRTGSHVTHAEAQDRASDDDVIVYWRPG